MAVCNYVVLGAISLILLWALGVYVTDAPMVESRTYVCAKCRAKKRVEHLLLMKVGTIVQTTDFSKYYQKHVQRRHRHDWLACAHRRESRTDGISTHRIPIAVRLRNAAALSILRSLPDARTRRAFIQQLQVSENEAPRWIRINMAVWALNYAYEENRQRRDWIEQVRKVGLYPKTVSNRHR